MGAIHISEADAVRDFTTLLARVRAGVEVIIDSDRSPSVELRATAEPAVRRLSESLRLAKEHASTATLDGGFGRDLESVVNSHPEPVARLWD